MNGSTALAELSVRTQRPLTVRQRQVLAFIEQMIASRGFPPTLREICAHLGTRSTMGANDHLRALERKGAIVCEVGKSRAIRVLGAAPSRALCAACGQPIPLDPAGHSKVVGGGGGLESPRPGLAVHRRHRTPRAGLAA